MENVLMRFLREQNGWSAQELADKMRIAKTAYEELEQGGTLMTPYQATLLGTIYDTEPTWFMSEALQLDLLLSRKAIILELKAQIKALRKKPEGME